MTYKEVKVIKGKKYLYERTSYRIGDKVKHRSKYLGPIDDEGKLKKRKE